MSTLTENAQRHIERVVQELSGDNDFMPFMTIRDHQDQIVYVGMQMPDEPEAKAYLADFMTALCMVHRGVEVTFASCTWVVACRDKDELRDVVPSQHPDRAEEVFLMTMDTEGRCETHMAPVVRENDMVAVGLWSSSTSAAEGRFAEAIHMGMDLGQNLPQEVCEYIDGEAEADRLDEVVKKFVLTIATTRKQMFN